MISSPALTEDGLPAPRRYWAIVSIGLGITLSVLDGAIANVALPSIAKDLQASSAASIWVVNAYQIAIAVALLPLASLGEIVGYQVRFTRKASAPARCSAAIISGFALAGPRVARMRTLRWRGVKLWATNAPMTWGNSDRLPSRVAPAKASRV